MSRFRRGKRPLGFFHATGAGAALAMGGTTSSSEENQNRANNEVVVENTMKRDRSGQENQENPQEALRTEKEAQEALPSCGATGEGPNSLVVCDVVDANRGPQKAGVGSYRPPQPPKNPPAVSKQDFYYPATGDGVFVLSRSLGGGGARGLARGNDQQVGGAGAPAPVLRQDRVAAGGAEEEKHKNTAQEVDVPESTTARRRSGEGGTTTPADVAKEKRGPSTVEKGELELATLTLLPPPATSVEVEDHAANLSTTSCSGSSSSSSFREEGVSQKAAPAEFELALDEKLGSVDFWTGHDVEEEHDQSMPTRVLSPTTFFPSLEGGTRGRGSGSSGGLGDHHDPSANYPHRASGLGRHATDPAMATDHHFVGATAPRSAAPPPPSAATTPAPPAPTATTPLPSTGAPSTTPNGANLPPAGASGPSSPLRPPLDHSSGVGDGDGGTTTPLPFAQPFARPAHLKRKSREEKWKRKSRETEDPYSVNV